MRSSPPRCSTSSSPRRARTSTALDLACAAHATDDVRRLAHRIRGASRAVGAQPLAEVAQRAESLAALGSADWDRFEILRGELSSALDEVNAAVRS